MHGVVRRSSGDPILVGSAPPPGAPSFISTEFTFITQELSIDGRTLEILKERYTWVHRPCGRILVCSLYFGCYKYGAVWGGGARSAVAQHHNNALLDTQPVLAMATLQLYL